MRFTFCFSLRSLGQQALLFVHLLLSLSVSVSLPFATRALDRFAFDDEEMRAEVKTWLLPWTSTRRSVANIGADALFILTPLECCHVVALIEQRTAERKRKRRREEQNVVVVLLCVFDARPQHIQ